MAKLWPSLSVLLVLVMLLFLVPTLLLLPGQNVSASDGGVVQEVEATLTFSVSDTSPGAWSSFTAGSAGIETPGLTLAQYTRPYVLLQSTVPNCGFRNYTTGSGNVVGDLNGSITLAWLTFNFAKKYTPTSLLYHSYTNGHFGFMMGRGHYYEQGNTSNNFTFVFVLDVDSDAAMTNAVGKGSMVSVEENGIFGNATSSNVTDMHKIIGDFDVLKSGSSYTWNLHLRIYDPSEVYYRGNVTVSGGVLQEIKDPINTPLDLLNFTQDGSTVTLTDHSTDFEEIAWGKDPIKNVTGGPLGANGEMDIYRNDPQYLKPTGTSMKIQASVPCVLYINDTNEGPRLDDGSAYGNTYYYLVLDIPYQELPLGQFFHQMGYTWGPFGMYLNPTDCYAGMETFANAWIDIESKVGTACQTSVDMSYGLYPTPKVESVFPSGGIVGNTMDVKIAGKYFLRAAGENSGWVPNSGLVDFGPNITVNSYTVNSAEEIIANITINGGAGWAEDVNVTSCFGYDGTGAGNGTDPYESGVLPDGFTVFATGATLQGQFDFTVARGAPSAKWVEQFEVTLFDPSDSSFALPVKIGTTNNTGVFNITGLIPETYAIGIKNWTCLSVLNMSVTLTDAGTTVVNFGTPSEGDCNHAGLGTDKVNIDDYGDVLFNYNQVWWQGNFDRDTKVDIDDYGSVLFAYGQKGGISTWRGY